MSTPNGTPQLPPAADPLGEVLHLLRLTGTLYCRSELSAPWGMELPEIEGCMMFHIVTSGSCILEVDGEPPRPMQEGSIALMHHGQGHRIRSDSKAHCTPLFDLPVERLSERYEWMRYGGGGAPTELTCSVLRFDHVAAQRLVDHLPRVLQIDAGRAVGDQWLRSTLRFISAEAASLRPGGETVITRLADILVIQTIRAWLDSAPEARLGWLAALRDEQVGRALSAIHRDPAHGWSVASLAEVAGMSRSAFSARFSLLIGESALRYLTTWRMLIARRSLQASQAALAVIVANAGYQSQAAFSRAFKRMFGTTPGRVRKGSRAGT
jgi:AraC-like DNA-binding protein